jgi:uncharacterized protein
MFSGILFRWSVFVFAITIGWVAPQVAGGSACVWRVTGANGATLYLGGSMHALRSTDYPLPPVYNRAFDASTQLAFEFNRNEAGLFRKTFMKAGQYPAGDQLKNHVDPRTYNYLLRVLARSKLPEERIAKYRPWFLTFLLEAPGPDVFTGSLGVETFLERRARANAKPTTGLESVQEHIKVFASLGDRESEACLLVAFINLDRANSATARMVSVWRQGGAEEVWRIGQDNYRDFPAMNERLLAARNRNWIPKIEGYLRSGQTYFVVVGAAHMGGPAGILALLRTRGYKTEQL